MRIKCSLCTVKRTLWESDKFFGIQCKKHFVPLIVLKEHKKILNEEEKVEMLRVVKQKYPGLFLDNTISDSEIHWHIHLSKKNKGCII